MYCRQCGAQNPDENPSCNACGAPLTMAAAPAQVLNAQTSGLAIAALVLGLLTPCTLITALPAAILGIIALVKISKSRGQLKGNGLAITGIVVPCVWMLFVLPLLMATLMPALAKTRNMAERVVCGTNMKQIGMAMAMHADDHGRFPNPNNWCDALAPYHGRQLICKSAAPGRSHYALNPNAEPNSPPDMVLIFETGPGWNQAGGPELLSPDNHEGKGCNILFCDFRVEFVKTEDLDDLRWQ